MNIIERLNEEIQSIRRQRYQYLLIKYKQSSGNDLHKEIE